jgi:hypothetical protein
MITRLRIYTIILSICLIFVGCKQKEEVPAKPEAPKPLAQPLPIPRGEIRSIASDFQIVNMVEIHGKTIMAGMFSNELFKADAKGKKIFTDNEYIGKEESRDPKNPNISLITYHYKPGNRYINIVMSRSVDTSPYRIKEIFVKNIKK